MNILLVGCGRMGSAMVKGWLGQPAVKRIDIIEPHYTPAATDARIHVHADGQGWAAQKITPDIVVLAVKPQSMNEINTTLPPLVAEGVPVLSIAAGITLTKLASAWGAKRPIIRSMPNTPGAIGQGVTGYICNNNIIEKHKVIAVSLLNALGKSYELTVEEQIDAVTAISGSGPAYVYNFIEALEEAGKNVGLPADLAAALARQTVIGSAALLDQSGESPTNLRIAVTSPKGTTEAALNVLGGNQALFTLLKEAVLAAYRRSKELANA
ncbi:MAG: pyrroline-5-carboxylate reductase [Alphaproteobacteria bacterium]|nr:pyrroline-5-carboxylate reductase [Alphaproteobacteria bacterium]